MSENLCAFHHDNQQAISDIQEKTSKHDGQWKILLWGMGILSSLLIGFCVFQFNSQRSIEYSVHRIDKTVTSYMAANAQKINEINHRLDRAEADIQDHEGRLRGIEMR